MSLGIEDVDHQDIETKLRQEEEEDSTGSQEKSLDWQIKSIPTGIPTTFLSSAIIEDESEESNLVNQPSPSHSGLKRRNSGFPLAIVVSANR